MNPRPAKQELFNELDRVIISALGLGADELTSTGVQDLATFDSIDLLDAVSAIEGHFDVDFTREELARVVCKEDLGNLVYRKSVLENETCDPNLLANCVFVIPVYNHRAGMRGVMEQVRTVGIPTVIVDDGSTDRIDEDFVDASDVTFIRHPENRGKGAALETGFIAAAKLGQWAITIDADGQHEPLEAARVMESVPTGTRPIVVGQREGMEVSAVPWTSRMGRKFSNFWVWLSGGGWLDDTQSGFRVYPLPDILAISSTGKRFQYEVEILALARWHRIPVVGTPISVNYRPGKHRVSHFRPWVDFLRNAKVFARLIAMRFLIPRPLRVRLTRTPATLDKS
jgi:acyl carrier protein